MRHKRSSSFGSYLTKAIKQIARARATTIPELEREITAGMRELGYPMSNYTVNGWRRGYVPEPHQIAWLVRWCIQQGIKDQRWAEHLLTAAKYPQRAEALQELFPSTAAAPEGAPAVVFLPPRPRHLTGRDKELALLSRTLEKPDIALGISGLPGVGKSALVIEVVHKLMEAANGCRLFPDGIILVSGAGLQGASGLDLLLRNILASFQIEDSNASPGLRFRTLHALAGKRALFILDDIQADFPLDQALEILLAKSRAKGSDVAELSGCSVMVTSRTLPQSAHLTAHLPLEPLKPLAAYKLLRRLVKSPQNIPTEAARQLCAAVGYVPLAIELASQAINLDCLLLPLLSQQPLRIDIRGELARRFSMVIDSLPHPTKQRFIRLAPLGTGTFSLDQAAALMQLPELAQTEEGIRAASTIHQTINQEGYRALELPEQARTATAIDLVRVQHASLLQVMPSAPAQQRYQIPPIVQAVNAEILRLDYLKTVDFVRQFQGDLAHLLENKDQLLSAVTHAWVASAYSQVVDLCECMYFLLGRLPFFLSKEILQWGIEASKHLKDRYYQVRFINRLGRLHFYRGQYQRARQAYDESIEMLEPLLRASGMRQSPFLLPWVNLFTLNWTDGNVEASGRAVRDYMRLSMESGDAGKVTSAYIKLAYLAWGRGDLDQATNELQKTTGLLAAEHHQSGHVPANLEGALFWARIMGDYAEAQRLAEQVFAASARESLDEYWLGDLKWDETHFALSQGRYEDAQRSVIEGLHYAAKAQAPVLAARLQGQLAQIPH